MRFDAVGSLEAFLRNRERPYQYQQMQEYLLEKLKRKKHLSRELASHGRQYIGKSSHYTSGNFLYVRVKDTQIMKATAFVPIARAKNDYFNANITANRA